MLLLSCRDPLADSSPHTLRRNGGVTESQSDRADPSDTSADMRAAEHRRGRSGRVIAARSLDWVGPWNDACSQGGVAGSGDLPAERVHERWGLRTAVRLLVQTGIGDRTRVAAGSALAPSTRLLLD